MVSSTSIILKVFIIDKYGVFIIGILFFFIETVEKEMGHFLKNFISNWKYKYSNLDVLATK